MVYLRSANPDFQKINSGDENKTGYLHPAERRKGAIPVAFQITSPFNRKKLLLPHALVMHINPSNWDETHTKKIERFQTRGGWVEQHWGDELTEISASGSTGAFMNVYTGLSSILRQRTIAWDRYRDLVDLFKNNAALHDPSGSIVLQGHVMLMFDRGTYLGRFRAFDVEETDESPFAFSMNWTFKVEHTILQVASSANAPQQRTVSFGAPGSV